MKWVSIASVCLLGLGALFVWITKEPVGLPEMDLALAGCASTYHKVNGNWPRNYLQLERSCDPGESRIINEIKVRNGLTIDVEPIVDGIKITVSGNYRGEFKDVREMRFSNDSLAMERK